MQALAVEDLTLKHALNLKLPREETIIKGPPISGATAQPEPFT